MTPELWQQVCRYLDEMLPLPADRRALALERLRQAEPAVAVEVASLLRQHDAPRALDLESAVVGAWRQVPDLDQVVGAEPGGEELPAQIGPYRVLEQVGKGGMGSVFRARDRLFRRSLAVKILAAAHKDNGDLKRRFLEEAQLMGQLQHPGIPPVHDLGQLPDGRPYFAMKLIRGRTLAALLKERTAPEQALPRLLGIVEQVCQTLAYAHKQGVIHRDLKPANVMVGAFGEVQVMDWGLAKVLAGTAARPLEEEAGQSSTICTVRTETPEAATQAGLAMGTPAYMAPEQAAGDVGQLDERTDVFGLGAILCEVLTGKPPYAGRTTQEVLEQARQGKTEQALARLEQSSADRELVQLARGCLAAKKEERPVNAGAVLKAMTGYLAGVQERLRQAELQRAQAEVKAAEERKRRRLTVGLAAALLALLGLTAVGGLWYQNQRDRETARQELRAQAASRDVDEAMRQADVFRRQMRWQDATTVLKQVQERLEEGDPPALSQKLRQAQDNVTLAAKLDAIRLGSATLRDGKLNRKSCAPAYEKTFREHGIDILGADRAEIVARIKGSAIRDELLTALDAWALAETDQGKLGRLLSVARGVDPHPLKDQLRTLSVRKDMAALRRLAGAAKTARLSPVLVETLTQLLAAHNAYPVDLLCCALEDHPGDFWLHYSLGGIRLMQRKYEAAIGHFRVALVVRPGTSIAYNSLGGACALQGEWEEALKAYRKAIKCDPKYADAHYNLGTALTAKGEMKSAIEAYRAAIKCDPKFASAHYQLGNTLAFVGKWEDAIMVFRQAIKCDPKRPEIYLALGNELLAQGQFMEARTVILRGQRQLSGNHPLRAQAFRQLQHCERLIALNERLPAVLKGHIRPRDNAEQLGLAYVCRRYQQLYATAVRFYEEVFAEQPRLANNLESQHRYNAACAGALAAAGKGKDAAKLSDKERAQLRKQAHDWLRADLTAWTKRAESGRPQDRTLRMLFLSHWSKDPDLASVRDNNEIEKLPKDERVSWRKLWAEVNSLLKSDGKKK